MNENKFIHLQTQTIIEEIELEAKDIANGAPDGGFLDGLKQELASRQSQSDSNDAQ